MAKPMKSLELHYPMIQFLIKNDMHVIYFDALWRLLWKIVVIVIVIVIARIGPSPWGF